MEQDTPLIFKFINFGSEFMINIDENNEAQCPMCKRRFRQLLQHFRQIKLCGSYVDLVNFKREYQLFNNRKRQNMHRHKKLIENAEETHKAEAEKQRLIRARKLNNDADETHRVEAEKQRMLRSRKLGYDSYESFKKEAAKRKQQRKQDRIRKSTESVMKMVEEHNAMRQREKEMRESIIR
jgi:hypothetical protein